jgi:hypothetical protein
MKEWASGATAPCRHNEEPDDRLGKQSVKLVRVATENADLTAES